MMYDDNFDTEFSRAISEGMLIADAFEKFVTGKSKVRRAACIQTLQAISNLDGDLLSEILWWSKSQTY